MTDLDVERIELDRDPVVVAADAVEVTDQGSLDFAGAFLTDKLKPMLKAIDASCKPVVEAANKAHKAATKQRATLKAPLLEAEKMLKAKIGDYLDAEDRRLADSPQTEDITPAPIPDKVTGISSRKTWAAEVVDMQALVLAVATGDVPISVLMVDTAKLTALVKSTDGALKLPGVRVYQERVVAARAS